MKIRTRLNLTIVALIGTAMLAFVYIAADEISPRYREAQEEIMVDFAETLAALVTRTSVEVDDKGVVNISTNKLAAAYRELSRRKLDAQIYSLRKTQVDTRIYVTDKRGIVIFDSDSDRDEGENYNKWRDVRLTLQGKYGARTSTMEAIYLEGSTMYVARPITYAGEIVGVLAVGKPTKNLDTFIANLSENLWVTGGIVAAIFALIGFLTYRSFTQPLAKIQQYAIDISKGVKTTKPNVGNNEIGAVEEALEDMRRSLDGKQYIEGYVQSLTHELKAPLAGIQGAAELLKEDLPLEKRTLFLNNIHDQTTRLHDLIERLLVLAKLENADALTNIQTVSVNTLLTEVALTYEDYATSNSVSIKVTLPSETLTVQGDHFLLHQAVSNLVKNAIEHAHPQTEINVSTHTEDNSLQIRVSNFGDPIPDYAIDKLFDRFYSLPNRQGQKGSGIGLSFVREVAKLHGGTASININVDGSICSTVWVREASRSTLERPAYRP
uniref:two-component system sensor histidine kinase CreC n=1 Tax=Flavobacterium sp. TaxID=239 RepID=UPI0040475ABF